jgi:CRISPR-associated protein Cas1
LADVFKPLYVFSTIKALLNRKVLGRSDFTRKNGAVYLSREGKRKLLSGLTDTLRRTVYYKPWKRSMSYRFMMDYEARRLKRHLLGRSKYHAFRPWWR